MMKKTTMATAVAGMLGCGSANAVIFNMTYMDFPGLPNPDVVGSVNTTTKSGTFNSGPTPFFGHTWTATVTDIFTGTATAWSYSTATGASATGTYNFTLGPGQVAMGLLWD